MRAPARGIMLAMPDQPALPPAVVRPVPGASALTRELLLAPRQGEVRANGLRFAYRAWGHPDAPLALCLHGFPDAPTAWDRLAPDLVRAGYRVVAPWMRGYAPTEAPATDDYGAATLGKDALALIAALGARDAVVIGHDWGAFAAMAAAVQAPDRVKKLVTVSIPHPGAVPPGFLLRAHHFLTLPLPGAVGRLAADDYAEVEAIVRRWAPTWKPSAAELADMKRAFRPAGGARAILGYYRALAAGGDAEGLGRKPVGVPTLAVYGTADGALEGRYYDDTAAWFTKRYVRVGLAGVGHFPPREAPAAFNEAVLDFLLPPPI